MRQDGSEKGAGHGEANFNCVTVEFGLKIEILMSQSPRLLDLILRVCLLSNFEGDFDRDCHSTHAPTPFRQPRVRTVFEGGSREGRGKGGALFSGHAHAPPAASGRRRKRVPRVARRGEWAERRRRKDIQSASELSFGLANDFTPRAQHLATRETH